jgi:hypothetical protein
MTMTFTEDTQINISLAVVVGVALVFTPLMAVAHPVEVPDSTSVTVRLLEDFDLRSAPAGETYSCSVDKHVVIRNRVAVPRGAACSIEVVDLGSRQVLRLQTISMNGTSYSINSSDEPSESSGAFSVERLFGNSSAPQFRFELISPLVLN